MNEIYYIILLPITAGLLGFILNRLRSELDFLGFFLAVYFSIRLFIATRTQIISYSIATIAGIDLRFYLDSLSGLILLFNSIFAFLIWFYSLRAMSKMPKEKVYYLYIAITLSAANGIVVCGNLLFLFLLWNILSFFLYGFLLVGKKESSWVARKATALIGTTDYLMMFGIVLLFVKHGGNINFPCEPRLGLDDPWFITSFVMITIGAITKAGAIPFHVWIPEAATVVPASTMAFIPASISRLLGIYMMVRLTYFIFDFSSSMLLKYVLMVIGVVTIIVAVVLAMAQKEAMKLLSFSTISQVGYMILGIGTGVPVGVAGGLYHMINTTIAKVCLFLSIGSVEYRTKITQFEELGGLKSKMPLTMLSFIVAALAISDLPPLNGFYSKWMLYQGVIELSKETNLWPIFLFAIMFGSVLTVVLFLKMINLIFLHERPKKLNKVYEPRFEMVTTTLILALTCVIFGIFVNHFSLSKLIYPSLPFAVIRYDFWSPILTASIIIFGILFGVIVFLFDTKMLKETTKGAV